MTVQRLQVAEALVHCCCRVLLHVFLLWGLWALRCPGGYASVARTETSQEKQIALDIVHLTNEERASNGLCALGTAGDLAAAARAHSQDMVELDYFAHVSPLLEQRTVVDRLRGMGGTDANLGENIGRLVNCRSEDVANLTVQAWMKSPGHRANILDPDYNRIGVGVVVRGNRALITQVFSVRAVELDVITSVPTGAGGFSVKLRGHVLLGRPTGAVLWHDVALASWIAGRDGYFSVQFHVNHPGTIAVGQQRHRADYTVVSELELGVCHTRGKL